MKNLTAIDLSSRLEKRGDGWFLPLPEGEVKSGRAHRRDLAGSLVQALDRHLKVHRPVLLAGRKTPCPEHGLWIWSGGSAMSADAISVQICGRTEGEFGTAINPHSLRHLTATTIATFDPGTLQAAAAVLGRPPLKITEAHDNTAKMVDAGRCYHDALGP